MIKNVKKKLAIVFASIILVTSSFTKSDALGENIYNSDNEKMTVYDGLIYQIKDNKAIVSLDEKGELSLLVNDKVKKVFEFKEEMNIYGHTYLEQACSIVEENKNTDYILEFNFEKEDFEKISMDKWIQRYKEIKADILRESEIYNEENIINFDIDDGNINDGYISFDISMKDYKSITGIYKDGDIQFMNCSGIVKELSDRVYVKIVNSGSTYLYRVDKDRVESLMSSQPFISSNFDITDDGRYITLDMSIDESPNLVIVYENINGNYEQIYSTWEEVDVVTVSGNSILVGKNNSLDNKYINTEIGEYSKGNLVSTNVFYLEEKVLSRQEGDFYIHKYGEGILIENPYSGVISIQKQNINIGWNLIDGKWYYYDENYNIKTGWLNLGGTWYYLDGNGTMKTGWLNLGGTWYYLDRNGTMKTGWLNLGGTWYYLDENGTMKTGWLNLNGTWYYLDGNGTMKTGWLNLDGTWYYLDGSGAMKTGWNYINNEWYYMYSSGTMAINCVIDGWEIDSSGAATPIK